jgi:hypothetical protein
MRSPFARFAPLLPILASFALPLAADAQEVETVTRPQRRAVEEYLGAVATGDPGAVAFAYHPDELERLRARLLELMRTEEKKGDNTARKRLFGPAMRLADLERMTAPNFYAALGRRLALSGRRYQECRWLGAIKDQGDAVQVIARCKQPEGRGKTQVVQTVAIIPYGKDWKASISSEIEAQIEDLIAGRSRPGGPQAQLDAQASQGSESAAPSPAAPAVATNPPAVLEFLSAAEKSLIDGNCEAYYREHMSPNFRNVTSKKALEALIASCQRSEVTRERLIAALRTVRTLEPRFEYAGTRLVYDLANQGLPFDRFALEQVKKRWYIAE